FGRPAGKRRGPGKGVHGGSLFSPPGDGGRGSLAEGGLVGPRAIIELAGTIKPDVKKRLRSSDGTINALTARGRRPARLQQAGAGRIRKPLRRRGMPWRTRPGTPRRSTSYSPRAWATNGGATS